VSIVDDIKDLFSTHAADLSESMHGIRNHLDSVDQGIDVVSRQLEFETLHTNFAIPNNTRWQFASPTAAEVLTVPPGTFYVLTNWAFFAEKEDIPMLFLNDNQTPLDIPDWPNAFKQGKSTSLQIVIPERQKLLAAYTQTAENAVRLHLQFKAYTQKPKFETEGASVGEES
jgi:hypothetical protein